MYKLIPKPASIFLSEGEFVISPRIKILIQKDYGEVSLIEQV